MAAGVGEMDFPRKVALALGSDAGQ